MHEVRTFVREGRRLAHHGDWEEASVRFESAARLAPNEPFVRCEAAFVALHTGRLDRAARDAQIAAGLVHTTPPEGLRVRTAACLYNIGLVAEALQELDAARMAYQRSLALRPNATVARHLAALAPASPATVTSPQTRGWITLPAAASDAAILTRIGGLDPERCPGPEPTIEATSDEGEWRRGECRAMFGEEGISPSEDDEAPQLGMAVVTLDEDTSDRLLYLVLQTATTIRIARLLDLGPGYPNAYLDDVRSGDFVSGGAGDITFTLHYDNHGESWDETWDRRFICTGDEGVRCVALQASAGSTSCRDEEGDEEGAEEDEDEDDCTSSEQSATITLEETRITIVNDSMPADSPVGALVGTRSIASLFDVPGLVWSGDTTP